MKQNLGDALANEGCYHLINAIMTTLSSEHLADQAMCGQPGNSHVYRGPFNKHAYILFVSLLRQFPKNTSGQADTAIIVLAAKSANTVLQEADGEKQPEIQSVT